MERVQALADKLINQIAQKANKLQLRQTAIEILTELTETPQISNPSENVSVIMPFEGMDTLMRVDKKVEETKEEVLVLKQEKILDKEVADQIALEPIKDLKSAIGINDRFQFIQELFEGDEKLFESSIKAINAFHIFAEAQFYVKKLKVNHHWDEESKSVKLFDQLVKRRFS